MAFKDFFYENIVNNNSNSLKLYHGTLIDNIESITAKGLTPSVGEFTKSLYNKEAMPLVFANDLSGARSVYCALSSQIQRKIGKKNHIPSAEEMAQHGALLVITKNANKFEKHASDQNKGSIEPNNYTSQQTVSIDDVLKGEDLLKWIKDHNADWGELE